MERTDQWAVEVQKYVASFYGGITLLPAPEMTTPDPRLPSIYSPVSAYWAGEELAVFFAAGEYDRDDARLLSVISRYKARVYPLSRTVFLNVEKTGEAVSWLSEPSRGAALVAYVYSQSSESNEPAELYSALVRGLQTLFGLSLGRMKEGLAQMDKVLAKEVLSTWKLAQEGRELARPLVRALNHLLCKALDEVLPPAVGHDEPLQAERVRIWKEGAMWFRFQSLALVEDIFLKREPLLSEAYEGLYSLNQNPAAPVDRVRLRVLTAAGDPQNPALSPFAGRSEGGSSLRSDFLFARRSLLDQHKVTVPDLVWCVAECPACRSRSRFRQEADPLSLYGISQAMERIKQRLIGSKNRATFYCSSCRQPLGFEHVILAAYAHYLPDQDRDLHFINERRPGRRRTFLQLLDEHGLSTRLMSITDQAVKETIGRPLSAVELWRTLLSQTTKSPRGGQIIPGFHGLALPPLDPLKYNKAVARFHDELLEKCPAFWPVELRLRQESKAAAGRGVFYPHWLGDLAPKVSEQGGYRLIAFVDMDLIEDLFSRAAEKLGLRLTRSLDGSLEIRGQDLTLAADFKATVEEAVHRGHFPGVFAVHLAGEEAKFLWLAENTLHRIRDYLGPRYSVQYNPPTGEITIEPPASLPVGFPLRRLVQEWNANEAKARQAIIAKVGR